jgi:hypothetical protein
VKKCPDYIDPVDAVEGVCREIDENANQDPMAKFKLSRGTEYSFAHLLSFFTRCGVTVIPENQEPGSHWNGNPL